jgi:hypothetical protein
MRTNDTPPRKKTAATGASPPPVTNGAERESRKGKKSSKVERSTRVRGFLIRIPDKEARLRAIVVLGSVQIPHHGFPDFQFLVSQEHIEALEKEAIPFETLS